MERNATLILRWLVADRHTVAEHESGLSQYLQQRLSNKLLVRMVILVKVPTSRRPLLPGTSVQDMDALLGVALQQ